MPFTSAPAPIKDRISDAIGRVTQGWIEYFSSRDQTIDSAPARIADSVALIGQGAAIGTTPIPGGVLSAGLYRASYHARITRAATTSSSLTPAITFTSGGVTCTHTGSAITGNTTASVGTGSFLLKIDSATPVSYSAAYASVGATTMQFELSITLERVDA